MAKFHLTHKAVEDLSEIWNYTFSTWSEDQSDTYYAFLITSCQKIAEKPFLGRKYNEVLQDLLGYKAGKHIIFYEIISVNEIEIIRILHEKMDLKRRITE